MASKLKKAIDHDNNADEDDYCANSTTMILIIIIVAINANLEIDFNLIKLLQDLIF